MRFKNFFFEIENFGLNRDVIRVLNRNSHFSLYFSCNKYNKR